jgi:hypothetical protein
MKTTERKCSIALFHNLWVEEQSTKCAQMMTSAFGRTRCEVGHSARRQAFSRDYESCERSLSEMRQRNPTTLKIADDNYIVLVIGVNQQSVGSSWLPQIHGVGQVEERRFSTRV